MYSRDVGLWWPWQQLRVTHPPPPNPAAVPLLTKAASLCPARCPGAQLNGRASGSQEEEEKQWHTQDAGTSATYEHMVQGLADLEMPIRSCLFSLGLCPLSYRIGDAPQNGSSNLSRCSCGEYTQRSLASLRLRKKPKSNCSPGMLSEQWWRKWIIYKENKGHVKWSLSTGRHHGKPTRAQRCASPHAGHFGNNKGARSLVSRFSQTSASALVSCVVQGKFINFSEPQSPICNIRIPISHF